MATTNTIVAALGDTIWLTTNWTDTNGQPTTPTACTIVVRKPGQTESQASSSSEGWQTTGTVGQYTRPINLTDPGEWHIECRATVAGIADTQLHVIDVTPSPTYNPTNRFVLGSATQGRLDSSRLGW
jgi:hypothetical protein